MTGRLHEPESKHATLWNEHLLRPTRHVYERSRDVKDCSGNVIAVEHLFRCVKTGAIRRWGLEVVR